MKIVAIVPTLDEAANVAAAVHALRGEADEVRVSDGGSRDDTVRIAREAGAVVVTGEKGYARQCNVAANDADVFWFVAADSRVEAGAGKAIRETLAAPAVTYGGHWLRIDDRSPVFRFVEFGGNFRAQRHRLALPDQGLFVRAEAFRAAGGMPEATIPHALLCLRLSRLGEFRLLSPATTTSSRKWREHGFWNVAWHHTKTYRNFRKVTHTFPWERCV